MTESTNPTTQVVESPAKVADVTEAQTTIQPAVEEPFDKDRAMQTINALREIEKQAKKDKKELQELRQREEAKRLSEMTELEKLQKQATETAAENARLALELLRRDVIAETGLPALFADRLKGTNKEEMTADALELLKVLPKEKTKPPTLSASNPGNATHAETEAQKRERLFGRKGNIFDLNAIEAGGGGVVWHNQKP